MEINGREESKLTAYNLGKTMQTESDTNSISTPRSLGGNQISRLQAINRARYGHRTAQGHRPHRGNQSFNGGRNISPLHHQTSSRNAISSIFPNDNSLEKFRRHVINYLNNK